MGPVCTVSRKLNLKFENVLLSVMYYGGSRAGGVCGGGVEFNKPAEKFKNAYWLQIRWRLSSFLFSFSKVIMRF